MSEFIIKIEKEDINTSFVCEGAPNISIKCNNNLTIIFTPEAIEELIKDYNVLKKN
jgi:hypothetical protein